MRKMRRAGGAVTLTIATGLLVAGCSGSPASGGASASSGAPSPAGTAATASASAAPSASAAAPADGKTITGTGYRYTVPDGWGTPKGVAKPSGTDTFAADLDDADGFADNVNVVVLSTGEVTASDAEEQGPAGLKQIGATGITVADRISVTGQESAHLTASLASSGKKYRVEQVYPTHEGKTYVVTFSFSPDVSTSDREALLQSVLATWKWS